MIKSLLKISGLLSLLMPTLALAAGIQVSPDKLDFVVANGNSATQTITVVNPTADVQVYEVYADDFTEAVKAAPASFTLESGGSKTVNITANASALKDNLSQHLALNLSVVGKPLADNKFSVGTGVKIPVTITVSNALLKTPVNYQWAYWTAALLALACLLALFNYRTAKRVS